MRFLIDAQLPPALARWLAEQGYDAEHVADVALANADDPVVWLYAESCGAIIVTKDEDFAQQRIRVVDGPSIVWIRVGNTTRRELLEWFRFRLPAILSALRQGETLVEIV